ncbi:tRNA (adenosine(37)-N6)-dimethylallyltransferase MiaA [Pararhizobium mangrovi]|nr:tRNA (adenosine(37)-N6)-dimethylallyltransferase MiaA [Pararhizobium mangrovi]
MEAIVIAGPTAGGKSGLAMALARRHGGTIVNADSMQVYEGLHILTARPGEAQMGEVPHRLYGHVPSEESYSVGAWYRDAQVVLADLRTAGRIPIVVGGTGLYLKALTGGLSAMPPIPTELREVLRGRLKSEGPEALHRELAREDPQAAAGLDPADGQRIVRALEVVRATGRSIASFRAEAGSPLVDPARTRRILVLPERTRLRAMIASRFRAMMEAGAMQEVAQLRSRRLSQDLPVMKAIGVRELSAVLDGRMSPGEAEERAVTASRQYAKRQTTWFRNQLPDGWEVFEEASAALEPGIVRVD